VLPSASIIKSLEEAGIEVREFLYLKTAFVLYGVRAVKKAVSEVVRLAESIASILSISSCTALGKFDFNSNADISIFSHLSCYPYLFRARVTGQFLMLF